MLLRGISLFTAPLFARLLDPEGYGIVNLYTVWVGVAAIAFTLQMVAQKYLHPVTATLLMSLESVFAVLGGWLFLNEILSVRELTGCAVIFCAVILAQLPVKSAGT